MAIAERWLAATFNRPGQAIVDHRTYVIASDGDLMEGVASEAASLAGELRLGRLIVLYDANLITLSATTNVTFSEDVGARFAAYGWQVQHVDGMDVAAVDEALAAARADEDRPSLIIARTHIGFGSPNKQDTFEAHGEPLGQDEVRLTKRAYGWPEDAQFLVPEEAQQEFAKVGVRGAAAAERLAGGDGRVSRRASGTRRRPRPRDRGRARSGMGRRAAPVHARGRRHGHARRRRQGDRRPRRIRAEPDRRVGRPRPVDAHDDEGEGRLSERRGAGVRPDPAHARNRRRRRGDTQDGTSTSASESTRWPRSSPGWRITEASCRSARRS